MKKRWMSLLMAGVMAMGLLTGCAPEPVESTTAAQAEGTAEGGEDTSDLPVLKVAVMPFLNSIPVKYMVDNGLDVKNGFKIETVYFANGGTMNEALAADQWEVGTQVGGQADLRRLSPRANQTVLV